MDIFDILNEATRPVLVSKEYRAASKQAEPYWDAVHKAFSTKFINEMLDADSLSWQVECREHFIRGLWLGLCLGQFAEQGPSGGIGDG